MTIALTVKERRNRLGLSVRDVATLAGVSYPTVSRIENGHEDPRWSTVVKLAEALGIDLPGQPSLSVTRLADLTGAYDRNSLGEVQLDFTALRAVADYLDLHPAQLGRVIAPAPDPSGLPVLDNVLAAMAETLADGAGVARPAWVLAVAPLTMPWMSPGTPAMRARHMAGTGPQFAQRKVHVPTTALWRRHAQVIA
jgi:transcriptional regulator with XRE-family HTH domain